nr:hypothetical protein Iba_chr05cCG15440 [Ipomoea batatas]
MCIPVGNFTNKHCLLHAAALAYSISMWDGGTNSSCKPERKRIGCLIWPTTSMVFHGDLTRKLRSLSPFESLPPINHFKKGTRIPAMSRIEVKVFSKISVDTLSGLFLASTAPTAPPSDLPKTTILDVSISVL